MRPGTQQLVTVVTGLLGPLRWMGVSDRWGFNRICRAVTFLLCLVIKDVLFCGHCIFSMSQVLGRNASTLTWLFLLRKRTKLLHGIYWDSHWCPGCVSWPERETIQKVFTFVLTGASPVPPSLLAHVSETSLSAQVFVIVQNHVSMLAFLFCVVT